MLIKNILENDKLSCHYALAEDAQVQCLDDEFYSLLSKCPEEIYLDMEKTVNEYIERVTRIVYLQGLKDFAELCITLKKETVHEILHKND